MPPKRASLSPARGANPAVPNLFGNASAIAMENATKVLAAKAKQAKQKKAGASPAAAATAAPPSSSGMKASPATARRASRSTPKRGRQYEDDDDDDEDEEEKEVTVGPNKRLRGNGTTPTPTPVRKTTPVKAPTPDGTPEPLVFQPAPEPSYEPPVIKPAPRSTSKTPTNRPAARKTPVSASNIYGGLTPGGSVAAASPVALASTTATANNNSSSAGRGRALSSRQPIQSVQASSSAAPGPFTSRPRISGLTIPSVEPAYHHHHQQQQQYQENSEPAPASQNWSKYLPSLPAIPSSLSLSLSADTIRHSVDDGIHQYGDYAVVLAVLSFLLYVVICIVSGDTAIQFPTRPTLMTLPTLPAVSFTSLGGSSARVPLAMLIAAAAIFAVDSYVVQRGSHQQLPRSTVYFELSVDAASGVYNSISKVASLASEWVTAFSQRISSPEGFNAGAAGGGRVASAATGANPAYPVLPGLKRGLTPTPTSATTTGVAPAVGRGVAFRDGTAPPAPSRGGSLSPPRPRPATPHPKAQGSSFLQIANSKSSTAWMRLASNEHFWLLLLDVNVLTILALAYVNAFGITRYIPFAVLPLLASLLFLHPSLIYTRYTARAQRRVDAIAETISDVVKERLRVAARPYPIEFLQQELLDMLKKKTWPKDYAWAETEEGERHDCSRLAKSEFTKLWPKALEVITSDVRIQEHVMQIDGFKGSCLTLHKTTIVGQSQPFSTNKPSLPAFGSGSSVWSFSGR